jgi:hypothetical protein
MRSLRFFVLIPAIALACTLAAHAQDDEPSLGNVARQARQEKEKQQKEAQAKPDASNTQSQNAQAKDAQTKDPQSQGDQSKGDQSKDDQTKDSAAVAQPKTPHVITNEDISSGIGPRTTVSGYHKTDAGPVEKPVAESDKLSAEDWSAQIKAQKDRVESIKRDIDSLNATIQFAPGNCVSGCVEWNERQKQKQDQVETMKSQLQQEQQRLEEMQEQARQQGYGSSVYDQ